MQPPILPTATLTWDEQGHPTSFVHEDIYYSRESGIEESQFVFLNNNAISERLSAPNGRDHLVVAEIGFGTGLNFLCTWLAWKRLNNKSPTKALHFISVEKWPIERADLQRISKNWPQLSALSKELCNQYPAPTKGCHRLVFEGGKVSLTLYYGDVREQYKTALFMADAWYLDGFAPHKNPEMWSPELFEIIGTHSAPNATFSTYSIAGVIRRGMTKAGFDVKKVPGFGRKKEMQAGVLSPSQYSAAINHLIETPWLRPPEHKQTKTPSQYDVIVIGAGLAGATTAHSLALRNLNVLVLDKGSEPATGGSGNPQGALYNKFSTELNIQTEYALTNLLFSQNYYERIQQVCNENFWSKCGLIQVAWNTKEAKKQTDLLDNNDYPTSLLRPLTPDQANQMSGVQLDKKGLYFPESGWVAPKILCRHLLDHENITTEFNHHIGKLSFEGSSDGWHCYNRNGLLVASANSIVVCAASEANKLEQLNHLKTKAIRGQVSIATIQQQIPLKAVICGDGYISPPSDGQYCFGATFDLKNQECDVFDADNTTNIAQLSGWFGATEVGLSDANILSMDGRASLRCTSPDYLPIVGPAPLYDQQIERFARLRFDAKHPFTGEGAYHPGLFVNIGHGSKGLSSCPLSAEYISSLICNEPIPLTQNMIKAISPSRFIIRNLIRRKI